jgi:hypothetical protein
MRNQLLFSLMLLVFAGLIFFSSESVRADDNCPGSCSWDVCVNVGQGSSSECASLGPTWIWVAEIEIPCVPKNPDPPDYNCHCAEPNPGLGSEILLTNADCTVDPYPQTE